MKKVIIGQYIHFNLNIKPKFDIDIEQIKYNLLNI